MKINRQHYIDNVNKYRAIIRLTQEEFDFLKEKAKAWSVEIGYYDLTLSGIVIEIDGKEISWDSVSLTETHGQFQIEIISNDLAKMISREVSLCLYTDKIKSVASDWVFESEEILQAVLQKDRVLEIWNNSVTGQKIALDRKKKAYIEIGNTVLDLRNRGLTPCNFMKDLIRTDKKE